MTNLKQLKPIRVNFKYKELLNTIKQLADNKEISKPKGKLTKQTALNLYNNYVLKYNQNITENLPVNKQTKAKKRNIKNKTKIDNIEFEKIKKSEITRYSLLDDKDFKTPVSHKPFQKEKVFTYKSALKKNVRQYRIENVDYKGWQGLHKIYQFTSLLKKESFPIKINVSGVAEMGNDASNSGYWEELDRPRSKENKTYEIPTSTISYEILNINDIRRVLEILHTELFDNWERIPSLGLIKILELTITVTPYKPRQGRGYIETPECIKNKTKCLLNIQNNDDYCFLYCLLYHENKHIITKDAIRASKYRSLPDFNGKYKHLQKVITIKDIPKLEQELKHNINIFTTYKKAIYPLYKARFGTQSINDMDLLFIRENEKDITGHYAYIRNYNTLMSSKKCDLEASSDPRFHCKQCSHGFTTQKLLDEHINLGICFKINGTYTKMPKAKKVDDDWINPIIEFKNHNNKYRQPAIIYSDFECIIDKETKQHIPCGFYIYPVVDGLNIKPILVRGLKEENVGRLFIKNIMNVEDKIKTHMKSEIPKNLSDDEELDFQNATHCAKCNKAFNSNDKKHRDHDHYTGKYRGACHDSCNINNNHKNMKIPVVFHNLKGYDGHMIIQALSVLKNNTSQISLIAQNMEKYMSFSFRNLKFIDSMNFMGICCFCWIMRISS